MRAPRPIRARAVAGLVALAAAGGGAGGDGPGAALEESLADAVRARLAAEAPLVALRGVECRGDDARGAVVDLDLAAQESVLRVEYAVEIGGDGCWTARPGRVEQLGAGAGVEADLQGVEGRLAGCLG
ncbi:MAG: hypothetical protein ACKOSO_08420 [Actinomycetota bacterium]